LRQAAVAPTVRVRCRRVHDTHIMSTRGAHYVVTYKGGHGVAVATLQVRWVEAGGIGGINSVGRHNTVPHAHETHIMSTRGAHYVGLVQRRAWGEGGGGGMRRRQVGCIGGGGDGGDVGGHKMVPQLTRDPHNEHPGCSLCGSHAREDTGRG
jgi:hypothetical protein